MEKNILIELLYARKLYLERLSEKLLQRSNAAPYGILRASMSKKNLQYYWRKSADDKNGVYLRQEDFHVAVDLAQKEYDLSLLKILTKELNGLDRLITIEAKCDMAAVYKTMSEAKRILVVPEVLDDDSYVRQWLDVAYAQKGFAEGTPVYLTNRHLRVRSKSEIIIANLMDNLDIPYRYEFPLNIKGSVFHPDFYCLNKRTRKEFVFEHFGMLDNPDYANNMISKINKYEENGFWLGKNLLYTLECSTVPLNVATLEKLLRHYLL